MTPEKTRRVPRQRKQPIRPSDFPPDKASFRMEEAEIWTGLSISTLYREVKAGRLLTFKVRGTTLIAREDLQAFLDRARGQPRAA